jgi:hypothetical protein
MHVARICQTAVILVLSAGSVGCAVSAAHETASAGESFTEPTATSFTESAGATLLDSYLRALTAGDSVAAGRCWARESQERPGFWQSLHIEIGSMGDIREFRKVLAERFAVVTGVRPEPDSWRLDFEWRPTVNAAADAIASADSSGSSAHSAASAAPSSMHYYVIRQEGRFVFVNPVDLLPRTWRTHDEGFCVFHYPEELSSTDAATAMSFMDARCREVAEYLGASSTREVDVYVADSAKTVGELILFPPSGGYCVTDRRFVISPTFVNPHEVVHLLSMSQGHSLLNGPINEGLAVALGGTHSCTPDFCLAQTRNFLGDSLYVPLPDLIAGDETAFFDNAEVTYLEAGAWVRFLLDRYGYSRLVEWDRRYRSGRELRIAFRETYDSTLEDMEAPWKQYVAERDLPTVGAVIPANAELIFSMDDAAGDDDGDGAYRYPTDPGFRKGALDLRKFEVLRDDRNAYFRLEFAEAGRPVRDEATGHGYTPGAIIALQRGGSSRREMSRSLERINFEGGESYDLQINVGTGIMVYDAFGRSIVASRAIRLPSGAGCAKSVAFSLPVAFIGSPSPKWKYFVGTVLMDDETLTYLRSYPEPLSKHETRFAICGGAAETAPPPPFMDLLLPPSREQKLLLCARRDDAPLRSDSLHIVPLVSKKESGQATGGDR